MKKNIFFKLLFLSTFVLALSISFVGCKNYDDDIDALEERVDALEKLIPTLGTYVSDVVLEDGKLTVKYTNNTSKYIDISGVGKAITIGSDGYWYEGGVKTNFKIAAGSPRVSEDGYLEFPEVADDGKTVTWKKSDIYASGAYIVDAGSEYELWIAEKGKTELKKIVLSKGSNLAKIDILGWIAGKGDADEKIARFDPDNGDDYVGNNITEDFEVFYAWVDKFAIEKTESGYQTGTEGENRLEEPWKDAKGVEITNWSAKYDIEKFNVLNTLDAERKGILINVHPADARVQDLTFEIQNAQDGVLPLKMLAPELVTGLLVKGTRAAESSALWFVPFTFTDEKFADADKGTTSHTTGTPASHKGYADHYEDDALYTLVAGNKRSEYAYFTITQQAVASEEAPVSDVIGADGKAAEFGSWGGNIDDAYRVYRNVAYSLKFNETATPTTDNITNMVVDYYVEVYDNNEYVDDNFIVNIDKKNRTFTVTRIPDPLTNAGFTLRVYKLGVDGAVYIEHIKIYPVQTVQGSVIRTGNYLVVDADKKAGEGKLSDFDARSSLQPMFAELTEPSGQSMTWAERWQNSTFGARTWKFAKITIDGKEVNGNADGYEFTLADGTKMNPSIEQFVTMYDGAEGTFAFLEKDAAIHATNNPNLAPDPEVMSIPDLDDKGSLYKARYFTFQPPYAVDGVPLFDIGAKYVFEIEFLDQNENYLSTATVELTPTLPALKDFFKKEGDKYWPGADDKNLSALYRTPGSHWVVADGPTYFYDNNRDGSNAPWDYIPVTGAKGNNLGSTFYNVFAPEGQQTVHSNTAPYDGGYTIFGGALLNSGKSWMVEVDDEYAETDNYSRLDYQRKADGTLLQGKINNKDVSDYVRLSTAYPTIVELVGQTPYDSTQAWGYNTQILMTIKPGLYLGVYDYTAYESTKDQLKDLDFEMKIMSAIEQGKIEGAAADDKIDAVSAGGGLVELFEADFVAEDYNGNKYNLFTADNGRYNRNDIYRVEFFMPEGIGTGYVFVDKDGDALINEEDPTKPVTVTTQLDAITTGNKKAARVALQSSNGSQTFSSVIGVRVIDRFGKVKETEVGFDVTVQQ